MNYCNTIWLLVVLWVNFLSIPSNAEPVSCVKFLDKYPIPCKTLGPLNIESDNLHNETLSPLTFTAKFDNQVKVTNDGITVKVTVIGGITPTTLSGGPLGDNTYIFHEARFCWTGNTSGPAASTVDSEDGAPIEAMAFWYNENYGSFDEAKHHRDGLAGTAFQVRIGPHNLLFEPFGETLHKIQEPGSTEETGIGEIFIWFDIYPSPETPYFTYPSSYTDIDTGDVYYCSTATLYRPKNAYISLEQFITTFLALKNIHEEPMTYAVEAQPQGNIPVVQTEGQMQIFLL